MAHTILVTGAFGLVGTATVRALAESGARVVATDVDTPANRRAADKMQDGNVQIRWVDLTDHSSAQALVDQTTPSTIIHLAAIIPPFCYRHRELARWVNVDASAALIRAAESRPRPPRFLQASSVTVYGARNPHRSNELLTADTPPQPSDNYGSHKVTVESLLARTDLDWLVLRLGGVAYAEPRFNIDRELLYFERLLPTDNRIQTVDVRDVAAAFVAAASVTATQEVLLIGGDDSHRQRQGDLIPAFTSALGLRGALPSGLQGDPGDEGAWFASDWMDCQRAQDLLKFQRHTWPDMMAELADRVGWKRHPLRLATPFVRQYFRRSAADSGTSRIYANPWREIELRWGDTTPDVVPPPAQ